MVIKAVVEAKKGTTLRYEKQSLNSQQMELQSNRSPKWKANYGFIEATLQEDGDELDVFVVGKPLDVATAHEIEPFAILRLIDDGQVDDKVFAIVKGDKMPSPFSIWMLLKAIRKTKAKAQHIEMILDDSTIRTKILIAKAVYKEAVK